MKYFIFLAAYVNIACGPRLGYEAKHHIDIFCTEPNCLSEEQTNWGIDAVIKEYALFKGVSEKRISNALKGVWISIEYVEHEVGARGSCASDTNPEKRCEGFRCDISDNGWCYGLTRRYINRAVYHLFISKMSECSAYTSLTHELLHVFEYLIDSYTKGDHDLKGVWTKYKGRESVSTLANRRLRYRDPDCL